MNSEDSQNFISIRRALKFCSLLLLAMAMVHIPSLLNSLGRTEMIYSEMMGVTAEQPWVFTLSRFLQNYFLFIAVALLIIFVICTIVTIRSKGGAFLYLNTALVAILAVFNGFLLDASQKLLRAPMDALMGP